MDIGHLSQAEGLGEELPRGDFERRKKFRYFWEGIGWGQRLVFQAKGPNSVFKRNGGMKQSYPSGIQFRG